MKRYIKGVKVEKLATDVYFWIMNNCKFAAKFLNFMLSRILKFSDECFQCTVLKYFTR